MADRPDKYTACQPKVPGADVIYRPAGEAGEYAPLATNPYKGCGHACVYCYVPAAIHMPRPDFDAGATDKPGFLARLAKDGERYRRAGETGHQVMLSFSTDPYHPGDTTLTTMTLIALREYGFGFSTLTKGGTKALRDADLFRPTHDAFASTLTSLDDRFSKKFERRAALPGDRLLALKRFHDLGIFTWVSLEPTLSAEASLAIVRETHGFVDLYKVGKANYIKTPEPIEWRAYTLDMINLLHKVGARHYIKKDLQGFLPAGYFNPLRVQQHHGRR